MRVKFVNKPIILRLSVVNVLGIKPIISGVYVYKTSKTKKCSKCEEEIII